MTKNNMENYNELKKLIRNESLRLLSESQAFKHLDNVIKDIDEGFIQVNEKRLEKLKKDEQTATEKEDYVQLKQIKEEQLSSITKLVEAYKKKAEYLEQMKNGIQKELQDLGSKGNSVFKDKEVLEFKNEEFPKNQSLKLKTPKTETVLLKISDGNQFQVQKTSINEIKPGDILALPTEIKIGGDAIVTVYRKIGDKFQELNKMKMKNIQGIIKNPS